MTPDTTLLQQLCDDYQSTGGIVDLGNRAWYLYCLRLGEEHNGIRIRNGTLVTVTDFGLTPKRYGTVELCRGITHRDINWNVKVYGNGPVNVTFQNVKSVGGQTVWTDDTLVNQAASSSQGYFTAGINAMNGSQINSITCEDCSFDTLFQGVAAQSAIKVMLRKCKFRRIAGASVVSSVSPDTSVFMNHALRHCEFDDVGSIFNFSALTDHSNTDPIVFPYFSVYYCKATRVRGRTKVHGRWDGKIYRCDFDMDRVSRSQFANLSFPSGRNIEVSESKLSGSIVGGFGVPVDAHPNRPTITANNVEINGGQLAFNCSCHLNINGATLNGCYLPWGASTAPASQTGVVQNNPLTANEMAVEFYAARRRLAEWNQFNDTEYANNYWFITNEVKAIVESMEA